MQTAGSRQLLVFFAAGLISGVVCWLGLFFLAEGSLFMQIYPGLILGLVLFAAGQFYHLNRRFWPLSLVVITGASIIGWRAALDIGYVHGDPVPMLAAGALGAAIVALGLIEGWAIRRRIVFFLILVTLIGAAGGEIARWIWDLFPQLGDDIWTLILFVEWQALVMLAVATAIRRSVFMDDRS